MYGMPDQAFFLFCESIPDRDYFFPIGEIDYFVEVDDDAEAEKRRRRFALTAKSRYDRVWDIWRSGFAVNKHLNRYYPPIYYIDWATSKDIEIPWLEWAKAQQKRIT